MKGLSIMEKRLVLEMRGISKNYGAIEALKEADLVCHAHSIHAIVG